MKYVIAIVIIASAIGYLSKEAWHKASEKRAEKVQSLMETSMFPYVVEAQPKENILARPMWVEETQNTLKVYCEYFGDRSAEAREKVRNETVLIIKSWAEKQHKIYRFIYVIFTDEVINPDKK